MPSYHTDNLPLEVRIDESSNSVSITTTLPCVTAEPADLFHIGTDQPEAHVEIRALDSPAWSLIPPPKWEGSGAVIGANLSRTSGDDEHIVTVELSNPSGTRKSKTIRIKIKPVVDLG